MVFARAAGADARLLEARVADVDLDAAAAGRRRDAGVARFDELLDGLRARGIECRIGEARKTSVYRPAPDGAAQTADEVVLSRRAVDPKEPTPVIVAAQADALRAVATAVGQPGRRERPGAVAVAAAVRAGDRADKSVRDGEALVTRGFAAEVLKQVWPAQTPGLPGRPRPRGGGEIPYEQLRAFKKAAAWLQTPAAAAAPHRALTLAGRTAPERSVPAVPAVER